MRNLARNPWRRFCVRREGLKVRRLPARQAEAENERDCCCCGGGDANDTGGASDVVFTVVAVVVVIDARGNELLLVLRRERMAEEKGRLSWVVVVGLMGWRLEPEIDQYAYSILSFIPYFSISRNCTYGLVNRSPAPGDAYDLTAEGTALHRRQSILNSKSTEQSQINPGRNKLLQSGDRGGSEKQ